MNYLKTKLGERPPAPRAADPWEEAQQLYREACDRIPALVDTSKGYYCELMRGHGDPFEIAFAQLANDLRELGIGSVAGEDAGDTILRVRVRDLRAVALTERAERDASFFEMMRTR